METSRPFDELHPILLVIGLVLHGNVELSQVDGVGEVGNGVDGEVGVVMILDLALREGNGLEGGEDVAGSMTSLAEDFDQEGNGTDELGELVAVLEGVFVDAPEVAVLLLESADLGGVLLDDGSEGFNLLAELPILDLEAGTVGLEDVDMSFNLEDGVLLALVGEGLVVDVVRVGNGVARAVGVVVGNDGIGSARREG